MTQSKLHQNDKNRRRDQRIFLSPMIHSTTLPAFESPVKAWITQITLDRSASRSRVCAWSQVELGENSPDSSGKGRCGMKRLFGHRNRLKIGVCSFFRNYSFSKAWIKSALISSICLIPQDIRSKFWMSLPEALVLSSESCWCVVAEGWIINVFCIPHISEMRGSNWRLLIRFE